MISHVAHVVGRRVDGEPTVDQQTGFISRRPDEMSRNWANSGLC